MVKPPPSKPYSANEKVLCDHQGMMYEAKILDLKTVNGEIQYLVHYQGWNNRWDEWVTDERLNEFNEENLKKAQEMEAKVRASGGKTGGGGLRSRVSQGGEATSGKTKTPATGGKSKSTTGSSGPSTPFDGSASKTGGTVGLGEGAGGGLELESRASTPSVDGSASVASTSTTGQAATTQSTSRKRKTGGKPKGDSGGSLASTPAVDTSQIATSEQPETPASSEPKRKRARSSAAPAALATSGIQPPTGAAATVPNDLTNPAPGVESYDQFRGRQEVQVKIPDDLKEIIVDDWDKVTRQLRLFHVPAPKTIEHILSDYMKHKENQKGLPGTKLKSCQESVNGIRAYFNAMCGVHLLYKFERPQYNKILQEQQQDENEDSSSADEGPTFQRRSGLTGKYGFPHLLRLFVRMGQMLAYTDLDQKSIDTILMWIQEFLKFLSKNKALYFRQDDDYFVAPPEYQRTAFN